MSNIPEPPRLETHQLEILKAEPPIKKPNVVGKRRIVRASVLFDPKRYKRSYEATRAAKKSKTAKNSYAAESDLVKNSSISRLVKNSTDTPENGDTNAKKLNTAESPSAAESDLDESSSISMLTNGENGDKNVSAKPIYASDLSLIRG